MPMQPTPEMKLVALSEAICEVLASVSADVLVFRMILEEKALVSRAEYEKTSDSFSKVNWDSYKSELEKAIREKCDSAIQRMTDGTVH
jgi:hypothetical protein